MDTSLPATTAPTMGRLAKVSYTHKDMIDFLLANPMCSVGDLAARYGYTIGWVSNIMQSDAWKAAYAARREEMLDPTLALTIEERMRGMVSLSLNRLQEKLEAPVVSDNVVLKALELGAKSLGLGQPQPAAQDNAVDHLARLANRMVDLQSNVRKGVILEGSAQRTSDEDGQVAVHAEGK